MRIDVLQIALIMSAALSACGQSDTIEHNPQQSSARSAIIFSCSAGNLSHEIVRRTEENDSVGFTYTIYDNKKRILNKKTLPRPSYAFESFGSGGMYQLAFLQKNSTLLAFSGNAKIKDKYGEYHLGDFKDGIVEFIGKDVKAVKLCDEPYRSDIAWADFEETLPSTPLVEIDRIVGVTVTDTKTP